MAEGHHDRIISRFCACACAGIKLETDSCVCFIRCHLTEIGVVFTIYLNVVRIEIENSLALRFAISHIAGVGAELKLQRFLKK